MAIIMHELNEEVFIYFARLGGNPDSSFLLYLDILIHTIGELESAAQSDRLKKNTLSQIHQYTFAVRHNTSEDKDS